MTARQIPFQQIPVIDPWGRRQKVDLYGTRTQGVPEIVLWPGNAINPRCYGDVARAFVAMLGRPVFVIPLPPIRPVLGRLGQKGAEDAVVNWYAGMQRSLGISPFATQVGSSTGGGLAKLFAARYDVGALVLYAPTGVPAWGGVTAHALRMFVSVGINYPFSVNAARDAARHLGRLATFEVLEINDAAKFAISMNTEAADHAIRNRGVSVMAMHGEFDFLISKKAMAIQCARMGIDPVIIKGGSHMLAVESPVVEVVAPAVDFILKVELERATGTLIDLASMQTAQDSDFGIELVG